MAIFVSSDPLVKKGVWSEEAKLSFSGNKLRSSLITDAGIDSVDVAPLDTILSGDIATFIKIDTEGAEYEALKGAKNTIERHRPKMAICIYHKNLDLLTIPRYLNSMHSNYKLYLRAHESKSGEVVLYCIP